jgi:uncharacterized membrane protein
MISISGRTWLLFAIITAVFWGIWGAFIEIPEKAGFPATLGYVVWSITMIPCALIALIIIEWKLDFDSKSIGLGMIIGLLGAGGQLLLFLALREGPAYLVFPLVSLFPIFTIVLSFIILKEKGTQKQWIGIIIALIANASAEGVAWIALSMLVFIMWGAQAFVMKFANNSMKAESIFFYMMISGVMLTPVAFLMTDFSTPINWGFKGPYLAFLIHILNDGVVTHHYGCTFTDDLCCYSGICSFCWRGTGNDCDIFSF